MARPLAVAITGGIGAGKSEALKAFARHGAAVLSSDEVVHELIESDPEVRAALLERLGTTERSEIAAIVFADREELDWLERLLHPRVLREYQRWREDQDAALTVAEVPLLFEARSEWRFDVVVVVTAPAEVREGRARVPLAGRTERLLPDEEKVRRADYAYVNDGSLEDLDAWVAGVVRELTRRRRLRRLLQAVRALLVRPSEITGRHVDRQKERP